MQHQLVVCDLLQRQMQSTALRLCMAAVVDQQSHKDCSRHDQLTCAVYPQVAN
jgi:hypothetical protein